MISLLIICVCKKKKRKENDHFIFTLFVVETLLIFSNPKSRECDKRWTSQFFSTKKSNFLQCKCTRTFQIQAFGSTFSLKSDEPLRTEFKQDCQHFSEAHHNLLQVLNNTGAAFSGTPSCLSSLFLYHLTYNLFYRVSTGLQLSDSVRYDVNSSSDAVDAAVGWTTDFLYSFSFSWGWSV